jgi:hypothetical protein
MISRSRGGAQCRSARQHRHQPVEITLARSFADHADWYTIVGLLGTWVAAGILQKTEALQGVATAEAGHVRALKWPAADHTHKARSGQSVWSVPGICPSWSVPDAILRQAGFPLPTVTAREPLRGSRRLPGTAPLQRSGARRAGHGRG